MGYSHLKTDWSRKWRPLSIIGRKYYVDEDGHLYRKVGKQRLIIVKRRSNG